jgi:hypothetical protein
MGTVSSNLHYSRHRDKIITIRQQGIMLRSNYEKLELKFFHSANEIVDMTRRVLAESGTPLRRRDLIKRFAERGMRIAGDEGKSLRGVLVRAPHLFERKGKLWSLVAPTSDGPAFG